MAPNRNQSKAIDSIFSKRSTQDTDEWLIVIRCLKAMRIDSMITKNLPIEPWWGTPCSDQNPHECQKRAN